MRSQHSPAPRADSTLLGRLRRLLGLSETSRPGAGPPPRAPRGPAFRVRNYDEQAVIIQCRGATGVLKPPTGPLHLEKVDPCRLRPGDVVLVGVGQEVPADGEVLEGCATIDQSAITGESTPVLREAGGLTEVLGGTRVLAGQVVVRVTRPPSDAA